MGHPGSLKAYRYIGTTLGCVLSVDVGHFSLISYLQTWEIGSCVIFVNLTWVLYEHFVPLIYQQWSRPFFLGGSQTLRRRDRRSSLSYFSPRMCKMCKTGHVCLFSKVSILVKPLYILYIYVVYIIHPDMWWWRWLHTSSPTQYQCLRVEIPGNSCGEPYPILKWWDPGICKTGIYRNQINGIYDIHRAPKRLFDHSMAYLWMFHE